MSLGVQRGGGCLSSARPLLGSFIATTEKGGPDVIITPPPPQLPWAVAWARPCSGVCRPLLRVGLWILLLLPSLGKAQIIEEMLCAPEQTDMAIAYGNLVSCRIDPTDDVDFFRFSGAVGELIRVQIVEQERSAGHAAFEVFAPDGAPVTSCNKLVFEDPDAADCQLTQAGTYTIRVNEIGDDVRLKITTRGRQAARRIKRRSVSGFLEIRDAASDALISNTPVGKIRIRR